MFEIFKVKSYLPYEVHKTIYDIDFITLYREGKKYILIDLDNTIIPYDISLPKKEHIDLFANLKKIGFEVIIISNNHANRVKAFADVVGVSFVSSATKPLRRGYKQAFKKLNIIDKKSVIAIGDQLMTDVLGGSLVKIDTILVKAIKKKSEKWYTKFNRFMEKHALKRIKKKHPSVYNKIMELEE